MKKSVTETHWKRTVNHWILKNLPNLKIFDPTFTPLTLEGDWDRDKEGVKIAWVGNRGGGGKKRGWEVVVFQNCSF